MAQPALQSSLNGGELSPYLYGRTDLPKYHSGLALCRNFFPDPRGGILNRSGTAFIGFCKDSTKPNRLIPFVFNITQAYALVFGDQTMRVIKDGAYVLEPTTNITAASNANPAQLTVSSTSFSNGPLTNGDTVFVTGVVGMTELNGRFFIAQTVNGGAGTFTLTDLFGVPVDSTAYTAYASGGTVARVFTLATPYLAADLALLKFAQSADQMTICHPSYAPRQLTRFEHWIWVLSTITFGPVIPAPTNCTASASTAGASHYKYVITALIGSVESRASNAADVASVPLSTTAGAKNSIQWNATSGATQYNVYRTAENIGGSPPDGSLFGFIGTTFGTNFIDNNIQPNFAVGPPQGNNPFSGGNFFSAVTVTNGGSGYNSPTTLQVLDATGSGATLVPTIVAGVFTSVTVTNAGSNYSDNAVIQIMGGAGSGAALSLAWNSSGTITAVTVVSGGSNYTNPIINVRSRTGTGASLTANLTAGAISSVTIVSGGIDYGATVGGDPPDVPTANVVDSGGTGAILTPVLTAALNNPSCTCFFQQRQVFGATQNNPDEIDFSKSGDYLNMDYSSPSKDDDAIQITINSQQVNAVKALVPFTSLIAFSSGSAWKIDSGQQGGPLTPSSISALPQAFSGCSDVPPIVINYDILYVQAKQSAVRDLSYNFYQNIYTGNDISVLSNHLFFGHQIAEWAWAEEPFKIVWAVRDDGIMLSLTYLKDQEVYAWARHDTTNGLFKSVCTIPEDSEDAIYVIVERLLSGQYVQCIERMQTRILGGDPTIGIPGNLDNAWFVDCGLKTSLTYPAATLTPASLSGIPTITSVPVINGGSGYVSPTVFVNDSTGTGASLTASISGGVITAINVVSGGSNYTNPQVTIRDSAGTGAVVQPVLQSPVVVNASASVFTSGSVGSAMRLNGGYGIVTAQSGTSATVNVIRPFLSLWPASQGDWSCTPFVSTVSGAEHLNGQTVSVLTDGNVQASKVVSGGSITLDVPASLVTIGLPIQAQAQSMGIDLGESPTMQTKRVHVNCITARVKDSRGLKVGHSFDELIEIKERSTEAMGQPIQLITRDERTVIPAAFQPFAQWCAQQDYPLPAQISAIIFEIAEGDTRG